MTAPTLAACPDCNGPEMYRHPAGLEFGHVDPCQVRDAEDATKAADRERDDYLGRPFVRPLTDAEDLLLRVVATARGFTITNRIQCHVSFPSPGIRRREFRR